MTPRGIRNCNPLNIRISSEKWQGLRQKQTDKSFFQFESMAYGYRAAIKTMQTYIKNNYDTDKDGKANELEDIIERWAPRKENDVESYISTVCKISGIARNKVIKKNDKSTIIAIIGAMSFVENGVKANYNDIEKGWNLL